MTEPLLTIALLIIVVCNLGVLWLFFRMAVGIGYANSLLHTLRFRLDRFIRDTDYDFRALKTRERNQEKAHQEQKRRERAKA